MNPIAFGGGCVYVCFLGPWCTSVSLRGQCNIFKNIASPVLFVSPIWCLRDTAGVAKARQLLLLALGPLRPKEITNVFTLQGVHHLRANIKVLDACWSLEMAIFDTCYTDDKLHPCGLKKTNKQQPPCKTEKLPSLLLSSSWSGAISLIWSDWRVPGARQDYWFGDDSKI